MVGSEFSLFALPLRGPSSFYSLYVCVFRLLLHYENEDGTVVPVWEGVDPANVMVLKDIMESKRDDDASFGGVELVYDRIPITAERPPDFTDLNQLIDVVLRCSSDTPIVVNCQLGRGRSTLASVCDKC